VRYNDENHTTTQLKINRAIEGKGSTKGKPRWTISAELPKAVSHTYGTREVFHILTAGVFFSVLPQIIECSNSNVQEGST
jgi:hypothetical protein